MDSDIADEIATIKKQMRALSNIVNEALENKPLREEFNRLRAVFDALNQQDAAEKIKEFTKVVESERLVVKELAQAKHEIRSFWADTGLDVKRLIQHEKLAQKVRKEVTFLRRQVKEMAKELKVWRYIMSANTAAPEKES